MHKICTVAFAEKKKARGPSLENIEYIYIGAAHSKERFKWYQLSGKDPTSESQSKMQGNM